MIHELKIVPPYSEAVFNGLKPFEVRKNDRNYQFGDILVLKEWNRFKDKYTGRELTVKVTYVLSDPEFVKDGYVILGIE